MDTTFQTEEKLPLAQLKKAHPSLKFVALRTVHRWTARTTRGALLESIRVGGRIMSSLAAVDRFLSVLNQSPSPLTDVPRSPHQRQRASEEAARELSRAGV